MPCTGTLIAMFSEVASTSPTAPTLPVMCGVGGVVGGATVTCSGCDRAIAKIANVKMRAATIGNPYFVMVRSPSLHSCGNAFQRPLCVCNPPVIHVGNPIGEMKCAAVVRYNHHRPVFSYRHLRQ